MFLHAALADRTHNPEIALKDEQAEAYAKAAEKVAKYHQDLLPGLTPYQKAWLGLATVAGSIYMGMGREIIARKRGDRARDVSPVAAPAGEPQQASPSLDEMLRNMESGVRREAAE